MMMLIEWRTITSMQSMYSCYDLLLLVKATLAAKIAVPEPTKDISEKMLKILKWST